MARPPSSLPLSCWIAVPPPTSSITTKPKPRETPVVWSVITETSCTVPNASNAVRISSVVDSKARLPTCILLLLILKPSFVTNPKNKTGSGPEPAPRKACWLALYASRRGNLVKGRVGHFVILNVGRSLDDFRKHLDYLAVVATVVGVRILGLVP